MQYRPTFGALSEPRSLSVAFGYEHNPKIFRNLIFFDEIMVIIEISYNLLYLWNCIELHGTKLFL